MEFKEVSGIRKGSKLLYAENQLYKKRKTELDGRRTRWDCFVPGCQVKMVVTDKICNRPEEVHDHAPQTSKMEIFEVKNQMKKRLIEENVSIRKVFNEESAK